MSVFGRRQHPLLSFPEVAAIPKHGVQLMAARRKIIHAMLLDRSTRQERFRSELLEYLGGLAALAVIVGVVSLCGLFG